MNRYYGPGLVIITAPSKEEIEFERGFYKADDDTFTVSDPYQVDTLAGMQWAVQVVLNKYEEGIQ